MVTNTLHNPWFYATLASGLLTTYYAFRGNIASKIALKIIFFGALCLLASALCKLLCIGWVEPNTGKGILEKSYLIAGVVSGLGFFGLAFSIWLQRNALNLQITAINAQNTNSELERIWNINNFTNEILNDFRKFKRLPNKDHHKAEDLLMKCWNNVESIINLIDTKYARPSDIKDCEGEFRELSDNLEKYSKRWAQNPFCVNGMKKLIESLHEANNSQQ